jgi:alpha-L-rhamnosidase
LILLLSVQGIKSYPRLQPHDLLVESLAYPEGIDTPFPRYSWSLDPVIPFDRDIVQYAFEIQLISLPSLNWTSGQIISSNSSLVTLQNSPTLPESSRITWAIRVWDNSTDQSSPWSMSTFTTGISVWDAEWVCGHYGTENLFRSSFNLPVPINSVISALIHVTGLGVHQVSFNGAPAGNNYLRKMDGGWTDYSKRVLYTTHDVTASLLSSENVISVSLGNSWFGEKGWYKRPPYGWPSAMNGGGFSYDVPLLLRVSIIFQLSNGSTFKINSSANGTIGLVFYSTHGPILFDSLYDGETYDGRRAAALIGYDSPGYTPLPVDWKIVFVSNSSINPSINAVLTSQTFEPVIRLTNSQPINMWSTEPGVTIYDFGENGIGNVRWTFRNLPAGTNVTLRYAEVLLHPPYGLANNSLYFDNLRNAHATDYYFADGLEDIEVYEPSFTWHGFRYAQISGLISPPAISDVSLIRQANGVTPGASASFSSTILAKIEAMAINTISSNLQSGPGSCGQRDERQFFTGDTQVSALTSMQHFRLRALFSMWVLGGKDEQNVDGSIGYYLPTPLTDTRDGSPQWSTGFITVTWQLVRLEGDYDTAKQVYDAVKAYINFNENKYNEAISKCGNLTCYWDEWPSEWQNLGPDPNPSCFNAFAYIHDLQMAGDIAEGIGEDLDAVFFRERASNRTREFHMDFFNPTLNTYGAGTQSELSVGLWLNAPPSSDIAIAVFKSLVTNIIDAGGKMQTGIVGERYFFDVLSQYGRADIGVRILSDDTFPSFGFMVQGADNPETTSTIWEIWDAYQGDPIMSSRNHLMFVSYASFLLKVCCGVEPIGFGFENGVLVYPIGLGLLNNTQSLLSWASGSMTTPRGEVEVSWTTIIPPTPEINLSTCGENKEAPSPNYNFVTVGCVDNATIAAITFSNFGTPIGSCGISEFEIDPSCSAANSSSIVQDACLGRNNCSVASDIRVFGDPCSGIPKKLAINVTCSSTPPPLPVELSFLGSLTVRIPVNLPATIRLPTFSLPVLDIAITEGTMLPTDQKVFYNGSYVSGVIGVKGAVITPLLGPNSTVAIDLYIGSGTYVFTIWSKSNRDSLLFKSVKLI